MAFDVIGYARPREIPPSKFFSGFIARKGDYAETGHARGPAASLNNDPTAPDYSSGFARRLTRLPLSREPLICNADSCYLNSAGLSAEKHHQPVYL